jgi:hypothetical protein
MDNTSTDFLNFEHETGYCGGSRDSEGILSIERVNLIGDQC